MTPQFSKAADPVFLHVLGLLDRIGNDEDPSAQDEQAKIEAVLDRAGVAVGQSAEWELAEYALICWIDEVLIEAPWAGHSWWVNNTLEFKRRKTTLANEQFYVRAKEASALKGRDALEVFYVCAVLGFRGLYRDPQAAAVLSESRGLPPDLETWAKQTAMSIRLGQGRPPVHETGATGSGAPPLTGQASMIGSVLVGVFLAALVLILGLLFFVGSTPA
jgi:type VI secretion system protein ImpK